MQVCVKSVPADFNGWEDGDERSGRVGQIENWQMDGCVIESGQGTFWRRFQRKDSNVVAQIPATGSMARSVIFGPNNFDSPTKTGREMCLPHEATSQFFRHVAPSAVRLSRVLDIVQGWHRMLCCLRGSISM
jgi:hypothetical protein